MFLKQATKVLFFAGLASVASTLALSKPAQAECYLLDLICIDRSGSITFSDNALPEESSSPDSTQRPSRRVPPIGTTRTSQLTDTYRLTRIQVTTHAHLPWVDTGIELSPGETVSMEAVGTWSIGGDHPLETNSNGYPGAYNPQSLDSTLPFASLIGVVGNGDPFFVGGSRRDTIMTGGRLLLSMNDVAGEFEDNSGGMILEIFIKQPL